MQFKDILYYWRKKKNISKYKLSCITGISNTHIRCLENGQKQPSYRTIKQIVDALNLSLSEFFNVNNEKIYLSDSEKRLLDVFRKIPKDKGDLIIEYLEKSVSLEDRIEE